MADFSANEWLIGYLLSQKKLTAEALATFHPSVCNRLDRNTSGLLLCGKSLLGTQKLTGLIRNRQIHKYYRLFLLGEVKEKQILTGFLLKDTKKNQVKILTKPAEGADEIKTGIEPLACLELPGIGTVTYAQAELFTGKTHQIRAHFAWTGHPLLGDPKYGNEAVNRTLKQTYGIGRQLLHAWQIRQKDAASGILPTGGITCPLPEDFQKLLSTAGIRPKPQDKKPGGSRIAGFLYYNERWNNHMATWNSRGLRGSTLEDLINRTNEKYLESNLALIQKIPTPITPIKIDKEHRHITLAYFDQKSTVDYIGVVQGIPVCFDAKECAQDTFALQNIHRHQVAFMDRFEKQKGIAFFLIYYSHREQFYYLPYAHLRYFWDRAQEGGRKSFRLDELNPEYFLPKKNGVLVPYLDLLQKDLEDRPESWEE